METKKLKSLILAVSLTYCIGFSAQVETKLIKQVSVDYNGVTDTVDLMPIDINTNGDVLVSGNQKMSSTQYNAATVSDGINTWIDSYNPGTGKAFITCSTHDQSGNTYVAGGIRLTSANGMDFLLIKYNNSGVQQWVYYYNGTNSTTDVVSALIFKNGNIYLTGASDGSGSLMDYATVKVDASNGTQIWVSRYDYSNNIDVPTGITFDNATNQVFVSGSSGTTFTNWDFATVKYSATNGGQKGVSRTANPAGFAQDQVYSMATDAQSNVYAVGTAKNGTNYNVQLVKLDTALNTVFTQTFDAHGYDDAGIAIALDNNANIYISGSSYKSNGTRELLVLKYDKNGNFKWKFQRQTTGGQSAEGLRIKLKSNNEIFVGGNFGTGNNQDIVLLCLDSLGTLQVEKIYDGTGGLKDKFMDLAISGDKIYVSARTSTATASTVDNNITITYEYNNFSQNVTTIGSGATAQSYVDREVIVSFNKKAVKMSAINDKQMTFGNLQDFVQDSTCHKILMALDPDSVLRFDPRKLSTRKIFFDLVEKDSLSETRTGNFVKVPEFYTSLVLTLPSSINNVGAISPFNTVEPDIRYAQLNNVFHLASPPPSPPSTNDPDFSTAQGALHAIPGYSLGHINVDSAWAVITGTSSIRAGMLDTGIEPGMSEFPANIPGFDFVANSNLGNGDLDNHGTPVAGSIGAIRNNNSCIAGVAGGDASSSQPGVTLYDCRCSQLGGVIESWAAPAFLKASQGTNIGGFAVHIINVGFFYGGAYLINNWGHGVAQLTIDNMNFANRNGVAMAMPKANFASLGTNIFPADWSDDIIMSVGSNGWNGEHCDQSQGNCSNASTNWGQIDFIAPGTTQLVKTISNSNACIQEHGTSQATPHVSGAAALLMGYRNQPNPHWNNLVHEDVEHILQRTATDLTVTAYAEKPGYDSVSGWGRINVYRAIREMNKNYYLVRHISESIGSTGTSGALVANVFTDTMTWTNYPSVPTGTYVTEVYKRTTIINFTLNTTETIIDQWPLNKECYGVKFDSTFVDGDRPYYGRIDGISTTACTMTTFYYKIPSLNVHMPYAPGEIKSAFSLYTYDSEGTVGLKENPELVNYSKFKVFPNPNSGQFEVEFASDFIDNLSYKLTNTLGQEVLKGTYKSSLGINHLKINNSDLTNDVYILTIFNSKQELHKQKIIKQ